jgi:hypothetical protein
MDSTSQKHSTVMFVHADVMASRNCWRLDGGTPPVLPSSFNLEQQVT